VTTATQRPIFRQKHDPGASTLDPQRALTMLEWSLQKGLVMRQTVLLIAAVALVSPAGPALAKKKPTPSPEFELAFITCKRMTEASGNYVIGPLGTNGVPVVFAGEGGDMRGEILMNACIADNLGTTVAELPKPKVKTPKGKLPLPVEYPLLPGDDALWQSLSREEQERALLFLKDGSSIRSSLRYE
jgi:hypothetical protein